MNTKMGLLAAFAAHIALGSGLAATYTYSGATADTDANALLGSLGLSPLFTAEARGGNGALNGDHELNWHRVTPSPLGLAGVTGQTSQFLWGNGVSYDFRVDYDPALTGNSKLSFTFDTLNVSGAGPLTINPSFLAPSELAFLPSLDTLWLRVQSVSQDGSSTAIGSATSLFLTPTGGPAIPLANMATSSSGASKQNYIYTGQDLSDGFRLTGKLNFGWTGSFPTGSKLDLNVKLASPVPETSTVVGGIGLLVATAGLYLRRRNR
jgi:hypothetical protein